MVTATRLVQVSDCHLSADPEACYRGFNADRRLDELKESVSGFRPEALVLTGDLSEDGSPASYERIARWAGSFGVPVAWLPGNHDDRAATQAVFERAGFDAGPFFAFGAWQLVLLDSTWPGQPAGLLDQARLAPLAALAADRPAGVFVHHQPLPVGARWIDKVALTEPERLWRALAACGSLRFVAFGHVHQRYRGRFRGIECLACPSTVANSASGSECFEVEAGGGMARWYLLGADGDFRSGYLGVCR